MLGRLATALGCKPTESSSILLTSTLCRSGGTGIHVRLRSVCPRACGFDSHLRYLWGFHITGLCCACNAIIRVRFSEAPPEFLASLKSKWWRGLPLPPPRSFYYVFLLYQKSTSECSSVRPEHSVWVRGATGSNPVIPTCGVD